MEAADDGRALDDGVLGQVFKGKQRTALAEIGDQLMGYFAMVEVLGIGGDAAEGAGQFGLTEGLALLVEFPVALEDAFGVGEEGEVGIAEFMSLFGGELKALGGQPDGRGDDAPQAKLAVLALGVDQAGN